MISKLTELKINCANSYYYYLFSLGRKPTMLMAHALYLVGNLGTYTAVSHGHFAVIGFFRFLVGMAHHTISHLPYLVGKYFVFINKTINLLNNFNKYLTRQLTVTIFLHLSTITIIST